MATPTSDGAVSLTTASSNNDINAILDTYNWGVGTTGTSAAVTYSFRSATSFYSTADPSQGGYGPSSGDGEPWSSSALTTTQQQAVQSAIARWAEVANITFQQVTDSQSVAGDIRFAFTDSERVDAPAWAWTPWPSENAGDVWLNIDEASGFLDVTEGSYGFLTFLHEIGHALGLSHPHEGTPLLGTSKDYVGFTVMSYKDHVGDATFDGYGSDLLPYTPMLLDILAIQHLYGANFSTRAGNDTYSWGVGEAIYETIWDGGGIDTIDWSNQTSAASINLNAGAWSSLGPARWNESEDVTENLAIAYNVVIEKAIGGSGNDTLVGNDANNSLWGRAGADSINGAGGNDFIGFDADGTAPDGNFAEHWGTPTSSGTFEQADIGGNFFSVDRLIGGSGRDTLEGSHSSNGDAIFLDLGEFSTARLAGIEIIDGNGGDDVIDLTSQRFDYGDVTLLGEDGNDVLWSNNGRDTLIGGAGSDRANGGPGADSINGGAGADFLAGAASNDRLNGGAGNDVVAGGGGNDTLTGGAGTDRFLFDAALSASGNSDTILDFVSADDTIRLDDDIFTAFGQSASTRGMTSSRFWIGSSAHDTSDRIIYDETTGALFYDRDGTGSAGQIRFAVLAGQPGVDFSDFQIVA